MSKRRRRAYNLWITAQIIWALIGIFATVILLAIANREQNGIAFLGALLIGFAIFFPSYVAEYIERILQADRQEQYELAVEKLRTDDPKLYQDFAKYQPIIAILLERPKTPTNVTGLLLNLFQSQKGKRGRPGGMVLYPGSVNDWRPLKDMLPIMAELRIAQERGELAQVCNDKGVSLQTAYTWFRRYKSEIDSFIQNSENKS